MNAPANERILLNFKRLAKGRYYKIGQVFAPADYDWYGDKEGRALLAFVSHYRISGKAIPCMKKMMRNILRGLKKSLTSTSTVGVIRGLPYTLCDTVIPN